MDFLDSVLPTYVDYLGRFESEPGYVESASDVMREMLERGVQDPKRFLPNAELSIERGKIYVRDGNQVFAKLLAKSLQCTLKEAFSDAWHLIQSDNLSATRQSKEINDADRLITLADRAFAFARYKYL